MNVTGDRHAAVNLLIEAVETHLSAYSDDDEMAETDQDMADALALIREAEIREAEKRAR